MRRSRRYAILTGLVFALALLGVWGRWRFCQVPGTIAATTAINGVPFQDIVGTYYCGDMFYSFRLTILANARFEAKVGGCFGSSTGRGSLESQNDFMILETRSLNPLAKGNGRIRLLPIRWGNRLYLVQERSLDGFCAAVARGVEPRKKLYQGHFYAHAGDWSRAVEGDPSLPSHWQDVLTGRKATVSKN